MKDEIKLKDMIDFLENIYKDIKKQPTLKEELERERKFINKIKDDNKDEVKELLEHIEILDNTDYILHSDKAKTLLNYITNLQDENEKNKNYSEFYKDMSDKWKDMSDVFKKNCEDYKSRNEKAIEFIEHENFKRTLLGFSENKYLKNIQKELLSILGGDE